MRSGGYKNRSGAIYFVSFAVIGWVDVFTYRHIVIESLKHLFSVGVRAGALCGLAITNGGKPASAPNECYN